MNLLKPFVVILFTLSIIVACSTSITPQKKLIKEEPVVIANDSLEYEITILDIGFNYFLRTIAQPKGYYSQNYLETRNRVWVTIWNQRALNSFRNNSIYENRIDYDGHINYGYEVNYLLYNYFLFAQQKYKINLGGGFGARFR